MAGYRSLSLRQVIPLSRGLYVQPGDHRQAGVRHRFQQGVSFYPGYHGAEPFEAHKVGKYKGIAFAHGARIALHECRDRRVRKARDRSY